MPAGVQAPSLYLERFVKRVCLVVPEFRGPHLSYPVGALILGVSLSECAGRLAQRSKAKWLKKHWRWIKRLWHQLGGERIDAKGTPSQSTISRLLSTFSEETFARLVVEDEQNQMWSEWRTYRQKCTAELLDRRKKKQQQESEREAGQAVPAVLLRRQGSQGLPECGDRT